MIRRWTRCADSCSSQARARRSELLANRRARRRALGGGRARRCSEPHVRDPGRRGAAGARGPRRRDGRRARRRPGTTVRDRRACGLRRAFGCGRSCRRVGRIPACRGRARRSRAAAPRSRVRRLCRLGAGPARRRARRGILDRRAGARRRRVHRSTRTQLVERDVLRHKGGPFRCPPPHSLPGPTPTCPRGTPGAPMRGMSEPGRGSLGSAWPTPGRPSRRYRARPSSRRRTAPGCSASCSDTA